MLYAKEYERAVLEARVRNRVVRPHSWWDAAAIYEIDPQGSLDSNGDGGGDLPGVVERLDYMNHGTSRSLDGLALELRPD